jgi:putative acetyltransferase
MKMKNFHVVPEPWKVQSREGMKMKIRKATKKDARKICNIKKETFRRINSKDYPKKVVEEYIKKQFPNKIVRNMKKGDYFVLVDKDKLLGSVQLYDKNVIGSLYIKYSEVGKGYGTKLMNFIENYAKKKGIKKLVLYPTITAKSFYKKLGYKESAKKHTWEIAGYKLKQYSMEKKLK